MSAAIASNQLVRIWLGNWVWLAGLVIGIAAVFWIVYDSQRVFKSATVWIVLSILGLAAVIPSFILAVASNLSISESLVEILVYIGIGGGVLSLLSLILYLAGVGVSAGMVCPQCGAVLDPSWDECPYCGPEQQTEPIEDEFTEPVEPLETKLPDSFGRRQDRTVVMETGAPHLAFLVIKTGPHTGKTFNLLEVTAIGRDPALNDIVIDDPAVSSQHAKIKKEGDEFVIYDLASTNHTFVNGEEILRQPLKTHDSIKLGNTELAFMEVKEDESESPPAKD